MHADEGLVGLIARTAEPLSLSDAQNHPAFSYRPETGEEAYHAFLGVPLLRAGNTLGVLVVQNRTYRVYAEEEIEAQGVAGPQQGDRKSTRLNSSHSDRSRMPSSA